MLREVLSSRLFIVGLLFFVLIVVGGVLYLKHVDHEAAEELARTDIAQGNPTSNTIAETQQRDAKGQDALYHARLRQYYKDYNVWWEKWGKAHTEWVQAGETLDNIGPRDAEEYVAYVTSLSETEKLEHAAKLEDALKKYLAASEKNAAVIKEKPVFPVPPQND